MSRVLRLAITASLALVYLGLAITALLPAPVDFAPLVAVAIAAELWFSRRLPQVLPEVFRMQLGAKFRLLSVDVLVAVLCARIESAGVLVAATIAVVGLLHVTRDAAGIFERRATWWAAGGPSSWRNLDVRGQPVPVSRRRAAELSIPLSLLTLVLPIGFAVDVALSRPRPALVALIVVVVVCLLYLAGRGAQYLQGARRGRQGVRDAVRDAVLRLEPEVVLHLAGRRGTTVQALEWVPTLLALRQRVLVLVREASHLDALAETGVPVVFAPLSTDVEYFTVPTIEVALYPTDSTNINNHLLRVPGVYDVLIGHGDSDEPENASPIARMYDEVWVPGAAGRRRYEPAVLGVPASRVRELGPRPVESTAATRSPRADRDIVIYAPTWENVVDSADLSSLVSAGSRIVDAVLARAGTTLWFVPDAAIGARLPEYAAAAAAIARRVSAAVGEHEVLAPTDLAGRLAQAALLITDVSPHIADAVLLDAPFAVPVVRGLTASEMRSRYPTTRGGSVLETGSRLAESLESAITTDRTAAREALAADLFASLPGDFDDRFQAAIDAAALRQRGRRAFERPLG